MEDKNDTVAQHSEEIRKLKEENSRLLKELESLRSTKAIKKQKRSPLTKEIYQALIKEANGPDYISVRLRIGFSLLTISGLKINEILKLKVEDIRILINEDWIPIDRLKPGHGNNKAFLTKEGKKLIQNRRKDFDQIFEQKEEDDFIFSSQKNHKKNLTRENFTRQINKVMNLVSTKSPDKPHVTSHSFKIGYIENLWTDSTDIKFVKSKMGKRQF